MTSPEKVWKLWEAETLRAIFFRLDFNYLRCIKSLILAYLAFILSETEKIGSLSKWRFIISFLVEIILLRLARVYSFKSSLSEETETFLSLKTREVWLLNMELTEPIEAFAVSENSAEFSAITRLYSGVANML